MHTASRGGTVCYKDSEVLRLVKVWKARRERNEKEMLAKSR